MLKQFVKVWIAYWLVVFLLPVSSIYPAVLGAFGVQALFVVLVIVGNLSVCRIFGIDTLPAADEVAVPGARFLIQVALGLSLIGLAASTYDKIYIQHIDYSEGVAFAREEWRRLGEDREGQISSIFSVIGYLLGSAYYVAVVLAITQSKSLSARLRWYAMLTCFGLVIANSVITGGRSNVLLLAAFAMSAFKARDGLSLRKMFLSQTQRRLTYGFLAAGATYTLFVFAARAEAGGLSALDYALTFLPFLGLEVNSGYLQWLDGGVISSFSALMVLALSYITHSFAVVAAILDQPPESNKVMIFAHISDLLARVGLAKPPDTDWFLNGRFPSLPGALLYQYEMLGFILSSLILGLLTGIATVWTTRCPDRLMPIGFYVMSGVTLTLSPALFAGDFLSFPFIVGSFMMLTVFGRLVVAQRATHRSPRAETRVTGADPRGRESQITAQ